jgi:hypothetical protein
MLDALESSAGLLEQAIAAKESRRLTERDFQRAMESVTGGHPGRVELTHWPTVGPVDLVLPGDIALELKWCNSGDTLLNCVWDIAKLGSAIAEGEIAQGLIVAGAPAAHWADEAPGVELFARAVYDGDALVRRYESWWRFWCKDVLTRPIGSAEPNYCRGSGERVGGARRGSLHPPRGLGIRKRRGMADPRLPAPLARRAMWPAAVGPGGLGRPAAVERGRSNHRRALACRPDPGAGSERARHGASKVPCLARPALPPGSAHG